MQIGKSLIILLTLGALMCIVPSSGSAKNRKANCDKGKSLQKRIDKSNPGDTISVIGICKENVTISASKSDLVIFGEGANAGIQGQDPGLPTMEIRGRGITIRDLRFDGGRDGIVVLLGGMATILGNTITDMALNGIAVVENAFADIGLTGPPSDLTFDGNILTGNRVGILVFSVSGAKISDNTITNNQIVGIEVDDGSSVRVGIPFDGAEGANIITGNGTGSAGITVSDSSSADIKGNTISGNTGDGVKISGGSSGMVIDNVIQKNTENGVEVTRNSALEVKGNLTDDTETNGGDAVRCSINSSGVGDLDGLRGTGGDVVNADGSCKLDINI